MGAASTVEQRWSQRRAVSLDVGVFDDDNLVTECRSSDVGLGGVFLELETKCLEENQEVELFFSLQNEDQTKHKLKARVVRLVKNGAGLMFKDFDTNSFRSLQEIMRFSSAMASV